MKCCWDLPAAQWAVAHAALRSSNSAATAARWPAPLRPIAIVVQELIQVDRGDDPLAQVGAR